MESIKHYSVLLEESIEALNINKDGIYVDGTLGRGGHSSIILSKLDKGYLYCFDRDEKAIAESNERLHKISDKYKIIHANFSLIKEKLNELNIDKIDGLLLDLGVSSPQFDEASRGFSYRFDALLDMRMDQSSEITAQKVVNDYTYEQLVRIFYEYGEEKYSKQIARKIEKAREIKPITTTFELVDIIKSALPSKVLSSKGHPAKKVFQAIRIEVNNELNELRIVLDKAIGMLKPNGRLVIISFQSLEDRIVKEAFNKVGKQKKTDKRIPLRPDQIEELEYRVITTKPILASNKELEENNRSHSAKLRVLERK